jgi:hypothetical protein
MTRMTLSLLLATFALSCTSKATPTKAPPISNTPPPANVEVSIASVTLADDCNSPPTTAPAEAAARSQRPPPDDVTAGASLAEMGDRACEQSSVQLRVANGTSAMSTVAIKKIELLDENGAVIRELTARDASQWTNNSYQPWNQQIDAAQTLQVSYALSAPSALAGGTYTVRVTVAAGDGERTLQQKTTLEAEASMPPDAVT